MPSNEQKRAAAKRKLQRQLERRAQQERQRRNLTVVIGVVLLVIVAAGGVYWFSRSHTSPERIAESATSQDCAFEASSQQASREVIRPSNGTAVVTPATQMVTVTTDQGDIPLTLERSKAPCTTQSFLSLAEQKFFDDTPCHRLTTQGIYVLQCGDPTGSGTGGPGYSFRDEYPIPADKNKPIVTPGKTLYTRGTLAMANSGPNTNGSQFFLVYKESELPPDYTIFGHIEEQGLAVLDKIAAAGASSGGKAVPDGSPTLPVKITGVTLSPTSTP